MKTLYWILDRLLSAWILMLCIGVLYSREVFSWVQPLGYLDSLLVVVAVGSLWPAYTVVVGWRELWDR